MILDSSIFIRTWASQFAHYELERKAADTKALTAREESLSFLQDANTQTESLMKIECDKITSARDFELISKDTTDGEISRYANAAGTFNGCL